MRTQNKGFTLVEIIVAITILGLMAGISLTAFSGFLKRENLSSDASALAGALREARSRTLASVKGSQYGVKIDADRFTIFQGSSFSAETADAPFIFSNSVRASTTIPVIVFARVTGNSNASGTIDVYLAGSPDVKRSVRVGTTGLVNIDQ